MKSRLPEPSFKAVYFTTHSAFDSSVSAVMLFTKPTRLTISIPNLR